jgi:DNA-binding FadR family transcriptional regulator
MSTTKRPRRYRERSCSLRAAEHLNEWIATAQYPLHSKLPPERRLCEKLEISRAALRNALQQLEDDGVIWRHVGKGTFVGGRPSSVHSSPASLGAGTTLPELLETRVLVEPIMARLAALRAQQSDLVLIERYQQRAAEAQNWTAWDTWDELFHRAVAEASGNGLMISFIDQLFRAKRESRWTITRAASFDAALKARYSSEHAAVISGITCRDPGIAEAAMTRHMAGISRSIGPALSASRKDETNIADPESWIET